MPPKRTCSSLPDVGEVAGEAAGDEEDGVDTDVVAGTGEARGKLLGCCGDAAQAVAVEREVGGRCGGALLDLDKGDSATAAGDQIDLAAMDSHAPREDPPAVEPQPPGGERLGAPAAAFGEEAVQPLAPSSSARA